MAYRYHCPIRIYEEEVHEWTLVAHTENLPPQESTRFYVRPDRIRTYHWGPLLHWFLDNCDRDEFDIYPNNETFNYHFRFKDPKIAMLLRMTWDERD